MDLVLGLSMTSTAVRWVLVEGTTGEGATVDRGAFDLTVAVDPDQLLDVVLVDDVASRLHAVGVTWTNEAEDAATAVLQALTARGVDNIIAVSELEAGDVLATGIAGIADYDDVAVCIVEPDAAVVAIVNANGVTVDRIARPLDGADVVELPSSVMAMLDLDDWRPDAIFVVGSADDQELISSTLDDVTESPVISAADADLALARGAALASAHAVNTLTPTGLRLPSRMGALTSVLVAAIVTFVVSLSVALGLRFTADQAPEPAAVANAAEPTAEAAPTPSLTPPKPKAKVLPRDARPVVAQTMAVAAPPAAPVYEPPPAAAAGAPPPAYPPPAPPPGSVPAPPAQNYVPPVAPQPRLRDRILERIPIINRFHEPKYQYPN